MSDPAIIWEWFSFGVRWVHIITAIAWIGSSFYFIALDLGLRPNPKLATGVKGEEWQVHGGGFYHVQKYMVAPAEMPAHLVWFKWESYATWLTGFLMLAIVYYAGADLFLIDRNILDVSIPVAIAISVASIGIGWLIYDFLCRSPLGKSDNGLMVVLFGVLVLMAWVYTNLFTGRAAFLHLGAFTATIMSANVFFIIIPNQKKVVADLVAAKTPDPKLGMQAKQRSLHNNYLTLPVIFFMVSNHYPLAFATEYNWIIAALIFLIGVLIRHFFNSLHAGKGALVWPWLLASVMFIVIMWLSTAPKLPGLSTEVQAAQEVAAAAPFINASRFGAARDIIQARCAVCHTASPVWEGVRQAPKNVILDNDVAIALNAKEIYLQAAKSNAMPPGNVTELSDADRLVLAQWYLEGIGK
jgi:uncharacterized membrane protein